MPERTDDTITVTGEAVVPATPDETHFLITVAAVRDRADDALQDVTTRSRSLDVLLDELAIPPAKRSTTGISVSEKREWVRREDQPEPQLEHQGFEAKVSVDVGMDDPGIAGRLLQGAVEQAGAFVDGPRWRLDAQNPAREEVYREAALAAKRKATAYTDALGLRLGPVRSITEPPGWGPSGGMLSGGSLPIAAEEIGLHAHLELAANVTIAFAIER
jgi:uncharacterized protein